MTPSPSFSTNNILTTNISNDDNNNNNSHTSNTFTLTLHLVRHAETVANEQGIVLGQSDSPLTEKGIQQAKAAHNSFFGSGSGSSSSDGGSSNDCDHGRGRVTSFWKVFSSDLGRCVQTARLIMFGFKDDDDDDEKKKDEGMQNSIIQNHPRIVLDKRLRERAKGIREGRKKSLSHEQILKILQNEQEQEPQEEEEEEEENKKRRRRHNVPTPFLEETEMQVMERFQDWLQETIQDAYKQYCDDDMAPGEGGYNQGSFHVLAVTHSGTLRIVLERLVGKQIPVDATRETSKDVCLYDVGSGGGGGRLVIPNTSKTVIQFTKSCCCMEEESSASSPSSSEAVMVVSTSVDNDDDDVGNGGITTRRSRKDQDGEDGYVTFSSSSLLSYSSTRWNATLLEYANVSHLYNHL
jgi:probable phosphoglycerate mutase